MGEFQTPDMESMIKKGTTEVKVVAPSDETNPSYVEPTNAEVDDIILAAKGRISPENQAKKVEITGLTEEAALQRQLVEDVEDRSS